MITPEILFFSELIRRGVIYHTGKLLPHFWGGDSFCGVILYPIMWIDCFGGKKLLPKIPWELISNRAIPELPHKIVFELIG